MLLEGLEWGTSEAVDKLKKMLWGLEALRVFDDRLSASLAQIQKARESMERTIKQVCVYPTPISRSLSDCRKLANNMSTFLKPITMFWKNLRNDLACLEMFKSELN